MKILKKIVEDKRCSWDSMLKFALWADRYSVKRSTGLSPFELVYGWEVVLPLHLIIPVRKMLQENFEEPSNIQWRINQMIFIEEKREELDERTQLYQDKMKLLFDKKQKIELFFMGI